MEKANSVLIVKEAEKLERATAEELECGDPKEATQILKDNEING